MRCQDYRATMLMQFKVFIYFFTRLGELCRKHKTGGEVLAEVEDMANDFEPQHRRQVEGARRPCVASSLRWSGPLGRAPGCSRWIKANSVGSSQVLNDPIDAGVGAGDFLCRYHDRGEWSDNGVREVCKVKQLKIKWKEIKSCLPREWIFMTCCRLFISVCRGEHRSSTPTLTPRVRCDLLSALCTDSTQHSERKTKWWLFMNCL